MLIEAKRNKGVGCIIGHFFLCYYDVFYVMQLLVLLNTIIPLYNFIDDIPDGKSIVLRL